MRKGRGLFVTGTDTGVGKTLIAGGLAACFHARGLSVAVMKPLESGCPRRRGMLVARDGLFLKRMANCHEPLERIVLYRLSCALAPGVAAEREGVTIDLEAICRHWRELSSRYQVTIIEGAGGLLVPIAKGVLLVDLIKKLSIPVLVVTRQNLGTINHTLLTLTCLSTAGIRIVGWIMNQTTPCKDLASRTNPEVLRSCTDVPMLGLVPYLPQVRKRTWSSRLMVDFMERHVAVEQVLVRMGIHKVSRA